MAAKEKPKDDVAEKPAGGGKKKMVIMIAVIILILGGGTAGTLYFTGMLGGGAKLEEAAKNEEPAKHEPIYFAFEKPFVVNFETESGLRFLQVGVELMSYDPLAIEAVKTHTPVIKNNIILMFSNQSFESLSNRDGKDKLRDQTLKEIQSVMEKYFGKPGVEEIYFTSFVMQ
ncbi:MAG: flagellar basal body-associated FliL family protein [Pseudomonadota bacterium]|nr:flagellar basal body-associated FliL family protein [Pseudomonadota bacterium]